MGIEVRGREKEREGGREKARKGGRMKEKEKEKERKTDREREKETERERDRERKKGRKREREDCQLSDPMVPPASKQQAVETGGRPSERHHSPTLESWARTPDFWLYKQ